MESLPPHLWQRVRHVEAEINRAFQAGEDTFQIYESLPGMGGLWIPEREAIHEEIVAELFRESAHVPNDRQAIILGGLSGAGKTSLLTSDLGSTFGMRRDTRGQISNFIRRAVRTTPRDRTLP
jgi:hypothetical protein